MARAVQILVLLSLSVTVRMVFSMSCKDKDGNEVSWYYVMKLPTLPNHGTPYIKDGFGYYYLDARNPKFDLSKNGIHSTTSNPIEKTLDQFYSHVASAEASFLMYNDHPPAEKRACSCGGHAKGVVAFGNGKGFWMIHSVPRFPNVRAYEWPSNAIDYGQSILCVTFDDSKKGDIKKQLAVIRPTVYFQEDFDFHEKILPETRPISFNNVFQHFAKSALCEDDLYNLLAEKLQIGLKAETWIRNKQDEDEEEEDCRTHFPVCNIQQIEISKKIQFDSTKDHSKWAITSANQKSPANKKYVCVGDLNRGTTSARGGGAMCANLPAVWEQYNGIIKKDNGCGTKRTRECSPSTSNKKPKPDRRRLFTDFEDLVLNLLHYI